MVYLDVFITSRSAYLYVVCFIPFLFWKSW